MSVQSPGEIAGVAPVAVPRFELEATGPATWRRLGAAFALAAGWLLLVVVAALVGPLVAAEPNLQDLSNRAGGITAEHPLGTDFLGRDTLSRLMHGAGISLTVGFFSVSLALVVGGLFGLLSGFYRGKLDAVIIVAMDVLLAFPPLVLVLAVTTFVGHDLRVLIGVIAFLAVPTFARVTRANALAVAQREFVLAARALGAGDGRILVREILPNVAAPVLTFALLAVAVAMLVEGVLAFLGLSVPPPEASWGAMIAEGRAWLDTAPQLSLVPAAVFFLTIFSLNLAADRLRHIVDVRESRI